MGLTQVDKERIRDSRLKIQSVSHSLKQVDPENVEDLEGIQHCLEDAERNLEDALRSQGSKR